MNKVIMMGRLTRDPEVRYSQGPSQNVVAQFSVAVNRAYKREGEPDADFFNCTAFGKQAEFIEKYLKKGTKIVFSGRLANNNYTNKDGQQIYGVKIMIETIEFAESRNNGENAQNGYSNNSGNAQNNYGNNGGNTQNGYGNNGGNTQNSYGNNGGNTQNGYGNNGGNQYDNFMNIPDGFDDELPFN